MKDTPEVNGINTLVGKGQFQKGMFIYIIFFNANTFEKSVTGNIQGDCCQFLYIWIRICNMVFQTWVVQGMWS